MPSKCLICGEEGNTGYYSLPKNKDRRSQWIESAKIGEWYDKDENRKKYHYVCFRHWKIEDIIFVGESKRCTPKPGMFFYC